MADSQKSKSDLLFVSGVLFEHITAVDRILGKMKELASSTRDTVDNRPLKNLLNTVIEDLNLTMAMSQNILEIMQSFPEIIANQELFNTMYDKDLN